jgi:hypothetical protein
MELQNYCASTDEEIYQEIGAFSSPRLAADQFFNDNDADDEVYIAEKVAPTPPELFFSAGDFVDAVMEDEDYHGDHVEWSITSKQVDGLEVAVREAIAKFLDENKCRPGFFNCPNPVKFTRDEVWP